MSLLQEGHIAAGLRTRVLGRTLRCLDRVSSTNDVALNDASSGLAVAAAQQTHGRGRNGDRWESPRGASVLLSVVVMPPNWREPPTRAVFAAANAVCGALRAQRASAAHIKWPNDILVGRKKIAGILCESRSQGAALESLVVGIGINVSQRASELPPQATSLGIVAPPPPSREALIADVLNRLEAELDALEAGGWDDLRKRWESMSPWSRGQPLRVPEQDLLGVSAGIEDDGSLRVLCSDGRQVSLRSGGVAFEDASGGEGG